ncbi:hypothetical protein EKH79_00415 [Dyella dinghuensis]|uniref:Peptidase S53 domain-containing protein n=1 Tax=Dyella dinghuensis TaxID=1920169 RepID=A0A432LXY1_9GAMM|nr:protease pro-enzyme activation domain-containing protein [Dyella dinghuensis]RUL67104.1 hypothetical protein EKH79_00415 [Dyella dinghuensis]
MKGFVTSYHFGKKLLTAIALAALAGSTSVAAQPSQGDVTITRSAAMVALHPAVTLHNGEKLVGPLDALQPMHVVVSLKLRNEQQLEQYIAKPGFRPLTSVQFRMLYAPTRQQAQAVADYLTTAGFANVKVGSGNAYVEADGRADTAQAAFNTSFVHVKTRDGHDAFANSSAVQVPANLQGVVRAVLGVQNVHSFHVMARYYNPAAAHAMTVQAGATSAEVGHQPSDFPVIYGASGMPNVTSVPVGSISAGPMTNVLSDLATVDPGVSVMLRGDTSVGSGSGSNSNDVEWDLDSQNIIAFTGVKQYYFYVAASMYNPEIEAAYAQVVSDNLLKAIDVSLGECESDAQMDGTAAANDTTFEQGVAQGQTFFVSAGDAGANECEDGSGMPTMAWPTTSQYVTSVGGTDLYTGPNTTWQDETDWDGSQDADGAGGGGVSAYEAIPSWQRGVPGIVNQTYRGVPDIAFDASPSSGALITIDGQSNQLVGGTSLSAPLAVGMWAHVLQANGSSLGFASPVIYKVAQMSEATYGTGFHDILVGDNGYLGYNAGAGWDYVSGWGSVIVNQFSSLVSTLDYSSSSPLVSFETLPALQVTTPNPGSTHTPGDFDGNGTSDVLWFNPWTSQIGIWNMSYWLSSDWMGGGVTRDSLETYNVTPGYFVGAVGDFNGDGYADLVFTSANRDLWLWTNNQHGGWTSTRINNSSYPIQWQLIGAGDINGDGHDDLIWLDPSECKFGYWTMNGATVTGYYTMNVACGYYPISIGYYTPSNRLSIVWTSAANDLYIWDSTGSNTGGSMGNGFNAYNLTSYLPANSHIVSIGGGYEGQNMGVQLYTLSSDGTYDNDQGAILARSFDTNDNQTSVQWTSLWTFNQVPTYLGAAGYVIVGNVSGTPFNNTGVYNIDPDGMTISTGGLLTTYPYTSGNAPQLPQYLGDSWGYPTGWWVVGALFNGTVAPPWK